MKVYYNNALLSSSTELNYTDVNNKPSVNNVELFGNKNTEQIKVTWFGTQAEFDALGTYNPYTIYIIDDGTPAVIQNSFLDLANKPAINGQVLTGKKLSSDLKMYTAEEIQAKLASLRSVKVSKTYPTSPIANTMYYVGGSSEGYNVYLFDSDVTEIDLGPLIQRIYTSNGDPLVIDNTNNIISLKIDEETLDTDINNKLQLVKDTVRERLYPIGSIFISTTHSTSAEVTSALGGTWVSWGTGRVPVGVNASDTDFNTVEKTGGAKTHTLTVNEMASHKHSSQGYRGNVGYNQGDGRIATARYLITSDPINDGPFLNTGGDQPHNNLQPYVTCYMYKRTG